MKQDIDPVGNQVNYYPTYLSIYLQDLAFSGQGHQGKSLLFIIPTRSTLSYLPTGHTNSVSCIPKDPHAYYPTYQLIVLPTNRTYMLIILHANRTYELIVLPTKRSYQQNLHAYYPTCQQDIWTHCPTHRKDLLTGPTCLLSYLPTRHTNSLSYLPTGYTCFVYPTY
jgi:hypothetical protein